MSLGTRSGVNWMRRKSSCIASDTAAHHHRLREARHTDQQTRDRPPAIASRISSSASVLTDDATRHLGCASPVPPRSMTRRRVRGSRGTRSCRRGVGHHLSGWRRRKCSSERRPVLHAGIGQRLRLVADLEATELRHHIARLRHVGREDGERARLDGGDAACVGSTMTFTASHASSSCTRIVMAVAPSGASEIASAGVRSWVTNGGMIGSMRLGGGGLPSRSHADESFTR